MGYTLKRPPPHRRNHCLLPTRFPPAPGLPVPRLGWVEGPQFPVLGWLAVPPPLWARPACAPGGAEEVISENLPSLESPISKASRIKEKRAWNFAPVSKLILISDFLLSPARQHHWVYIGQAGQKGGQAGRCPGRKWGLVRPGHALAWRRFPHAYLLRIRASRPPQELPSSVVWHAVSKSVRVFNAQGDVPHGATFQAIVTQVVGIWGRGCLGSTQPGPLFWCTE